MNNQLQKGLSDLENLILIQRSCIINGDPSFDYMHGMINGMLCAHSCFTKHTPVYYTINNRAYKNKNRIRHKAKK